MLQNITLREFRQSLGCLPNDITIK